MSQPLITVDAALQALASANTPDELIKLANQEAALRVYAKRDGPPEPLCGTPAPRRIEARGTPRDI
jgi:hypothetical protein